jgi:phospholipid/cholesterol/gamma-HCH transport system substrate-binding protein
MSVAENKRSVVVGIFVFIGIALFVAGVLVLGGQQKRFVQSIKVKAIFADAEGLKSGNNVRFSGVKIGTVKDIKFYGDSQVEITMNVDEEARKYIHKDAKAKIGSESLIGNKNVVIFGGTPEAPMVEENDMLQVQKTISSDDIMNTLQENNKNLVSITTDFKAISSQIAKGQGTLGALLKDSTLANNFRATLTNLERASATTAKASGALSQFTTRLNNKKGLANQLLTDTVAFRDLKASLAHLEASAASAQELTQNLKTASSKLNSSNNAMGLLLNDPEFAAKLKSTMINLEGGTQKFEENMDALQENVFLKDYLKIKARKGRQKQTEPKPPVKK